MMVRRVFPLAALAVFLLAAPARAAEVMVMAMADRWGSRILVENVRTLPPTRAPYTVRLRSREYVLPGNVVSFTISVRLRWNPEVKLYRYLCSPNRWDQAAIMIGAGDMNMGGGSGMGMQGRFVGHMGSCRVAGRVTRR